MLMASLFSAKALVEYGANLVSDFDPDASYFGEQSFYYCFRVHSIHLIKNFTPLCASPVRKRVRPLEGN
jgi:heme/copper-type cytochrome/quinol oxidase subunit 3